ncbi:MAG: hypothetical protein C0404_05125 [Verrucomicrobia bacterium]|nr:hypothetical protein [Verrucomicrobiota bacterium]
MAVYKQMARRLAILLCAWLTASLSAAAAGNVALVRGTLSAPNDAERNYAQSVTRNLGRLLTDLNVAHVVIDDDAVTASSLDGVRVVILGYNPFPPAAELKALRSFAGGGGKIIVFYGADEGLAELLQVKMGKYTAAEKFGQWGMIGFNESAPAHMPETVLQNSNNIRPVYAIDGKSKIIAVWLTQAGKATGQPAWVQSERGFWMSHVLLDDGDSWNKRLMMAGLIGACDASIWKPVAERCLEQAATLGKYTGFPETTRAILAQAGGRGTQAAESFLDKATVLNADLSKLMDQKQYQQVVRKSRELKDALARAYGAAQEGRDGEFRGVWDRKGMGLYPGNWDETCRVLKTHGMTDLMPHMLSPGSCHYASKLMDPSDAVQQFGDQAAQCVEAAHRNGLKVHAWKICWRVDAAPADFVARMKKQNRLQMSDTGKAVNWLCPSRADNREMERNTLVEVVTKYRVDGVHLDYIRYTDGHACYCETCRGSFEKQVGKKLSAWPEAVKSGELKKEYTRWRAGQITAFVREVSAAVKEARPDVKVSAAVYGRYPLCIDSVGQDWAEWLRKGYVDFVCPMDYTADMEKFGVYIQGQMALDGIKAKIYPGIGVTATESRLDAVQVVDQVRALRGAGAGGFALFELNKVLEKETLPVLGLGLTSTVRAK